MAKIDTLHIRIEPEIKMQAEQTFRDLGITTADAVNIFLRKAINSGGFPFAVRRTYNAETLAAAREAAHAESRRKLLEQIAQMQAKKG